MSTTLIVFLTGAAGFLLLLVGSRAATASAGPADPEAPERTEHWLVERIERHTRLARALSHVERRVAGGLSVAIAFAAVFAGGLAVGWILDTLDTNRGFARWDESVAEWGAANADSVTVDVLQWVTELGGSPYLTVVVVLAGAAIWLADRNRTPLHYLGVVVAGILLVNNGLKLLIERDRPDVEHLVGASGFSFPSGHSATAAAVWAALALVGSRYVKRRARIVLMAVASGIAALVAASRALLGVHWLTDVIAGVIVGWTWFFLVSITFGGRILRFGDMVEQLDPDGETDHDRDHITGRPDHVVATGNRGGHTS